MATYTKVAKPTTNYTGIGKSTTSYSKIAEPSFTDLFLLQTGDLLLLQSGDSLIIRETVGSEWSRIVKS